MSFNPTVVLVTGAFHVSSVMHLLSGKLQQAGYSTRSMGLKTPGNSGLSINDDATALKTELLNPLIEQLGKHVVLYLHSYAGFPGSAAIRGLSQQERAAQGKKGGIIGLIYQSAFIPKEGNTQSKCSVDFMPLGNPQTCVDYIFFDLLTCLASLELTFG